MSIIEMLRRLFGAPVQNGVAADDGDITCDQALAVVHEYLDGELDQLTPAQVKKHFDVCAMCYPYLRLEEAFREAVRRASAEQTAPPELRAKLLQVLAEAND